MQPTTHAHLARATRNRDVATALAEERNRLALQPPPLDWAAVAAFYAAVHYVNAYLWDKQQYEPPTHEQRVRAVSAVADLRAARSHYVRLQDLAFRVRYVSTYYPSRPVVDELLQVNLPTVASAVLTALGIRP